jgi:hypothetical protein
MFSKYHATLHYPEVLLPTVSLVPAVCAPYRYAHMYPQMIRIFGSARICDAGRGESLHKDVKTIFRRTSRRRRDFLNEINAKADTFSRLQHLCSDHGLAYESHGEDEADGTECRRNRPFQTYQTSGATLNTCLHSVENE